MSQKVREMSVCTIKPRELQELRRRGIPVELIDVRTPVEYRELHAEPARLVPLDELDPRKVMEGRIGEPHDPLYVICRSGSRGAPGLRAVSGRRVSQRGQCRRGHAGLGAGWTARLPGQEDDIVGTPGADCRRLARHARCDARVLRASGLPRFGGVRRGRLGLRRHHGHVRDGNAVGEDAVESCQ